MFDQMEKELDTLSYTSPAGQGLSNDLRSSSEPKVGLGSRQYSESEEIGDNLGSSKSVSEKGSKKKRGKHPGPAKMGTFENDHDNQESLPTKVKKNQRKNKDASSLGAFDAKSGIKKGSDKVKEDNLNTISEEWIVQRILTLAPDLGELGGLNNSLILLHALSSTHMNV